MRAPISFMQIGRPDDEPVVNAHASEREKLVRDINSLKESISVAWMDMISKPMTAAERGELRRSIDSLVKDLDSLRSKLDRLPKTQA